MDDKSPVVMEECVNDERDDGGILIWLRKLRQKYMVHRQMIHKLMINREMNQQQLKVQPLKMLMGNIKEVNFHC